MLSFLHDWSRRTGIEVVLDIDDNFGRLPEAIELSIFHIVQEGLNNIWKQSSASSVSVTLEHTSPRMLLVSLEDNGIGLQEGYDLAALSRKGRWVSASG